MLRHTPVPRGWILLVSPDRVKDLIPKNSTKADILKFVLKNLAPRLSLCSDRHQTLNNSLSFLIPMQTGTMLMHSMPPPG